ncbi:hypothetical protein BGZ65_011059 [Modicella reniformis]|uniref:Uncharacterized protein n=1 Tax=Modicella reniformis TaxID=1440133 RepID=A0A9P6SRA3_9FUNG|nr:hypothetical protein BGZ65_011059 [Modicella reniformis]
MAVAENVSFLIEGKKVADEEDDKDNVVSDVSSARPSLSTENMKYINHLVRPGTTSSKLRTELSLCSLNFILTTNS